MNLRITAVLQMYDITSVLRWGRSTDLSNFGNEWKHKAKDKWDYM